MSKLDELATILVDKSITDNEAIRRLIRLGITAQIAAEMVIAFRQRPVDPPAKSLERPVSSENDNDGCHQSNER